MSEGYRTPEQKLADLGIGPVRQRRPRPSRFNGSGNGQHIGDTGPEAPPAGEPPRFKLECLDLGELTNKPIPPRPTDLQAALAYTFTRAICNSHRSGWLIDYLNKLPGIKVEHKQKTEIETGI
jgi:hypothetical protein